MTFLETCMISSFVEETEQTRNEQLQQSIALYKVMHDQPTSSPDESKTSSMQSKIMGRVYSNLGGSSSIYNQSLVTYDSNVSIKTDDMVHNVISYNRQPLVSGDSRS